MLNQQCPSSQGVPYRLHRRPLGPYGPPVSRSDRPELTDSAHFQLFAGRLVEIALGRFWDKVETRGDCWLWTGARTHEGYGNYWDGSRFWGAHRFAYAIYGGDIPDGWVIDHLCREPRCVRPEHLEAVTNQENAIRGFRLVNAKKCHRGHPMEGDNVVWLDREAGEQACRRCRSAAFSAGRRTFA